MTYAHNVITKSNMKNKNIANWKYELNYNKTKIKIKQH